MFGKRYSEITDATKQLMLGDADLFYTWGYHTNDPLGPHANQFLWHDLPAKHPNEVTFGGSWYYAPRCNLAFLDSHAEFIQLGPHNIGDSDVNTDKYILDPDDGTP